MDTYGTHQHALVAALMRTQGHVLELGCGDYSTPILHEICQATGRRLVSTDYNKEWLERYRELQSPDHELFHVQDWAAFSRIDMPWGLVFVDHSPGERRVFDIERVRLNAEMVVVHDTEEGGYKYEPYLARFRYRRDYKTHRPWTTILSMVHPLDWK